MGIPSILELSDKMTCYVRARYDVEPVKRQWYEWLHRMRIRLLDWYCRLHTQEVEPLFLLESGTATGSSLLQDNPELIGTFSGSVLFSNEYFFEMLLLYWIGWIMIYSSITTVYNSMTERTMRLINDSDNITTQGCDALKEIELTAEYSAEKLCQAVAFGEKPAVGAASFQIMLPGLWAAQQYFAGRSSRKSRWCQMVAKGLEKKGFMLAPFVTTISPRGFLEMAEALRVRRDQEAQNYYAKSE
jgi:hypothetical protein